MAAKAYSVLPDFDKKLMFDGVQLSDAKEDVFLSKSITSEDEIKIKKKAWKITLPPVKHQKQMTVVNETKIGEPKQTRVEQTVKPMSKVRDKATSPLRIDETELITLLVKLLNND